ncbi:MAG: OadG family protein [Halomonas subglaciescola]|nr:OadG family protein [Halomonas subglaciescola]
MQDDLLSEGLTLMTLGMGFVFVFLTLLVLTTSLMSWIIRRYFPQLHPQPQSQVQAQPRADTDLATPSPMEDTTLMAVIGAAVHRHRKRRR